MLSRVVFILIVVFWLTMNVLLWRTEFSSRPSATSAVPVELVWEKVLTSPDSSSLSILHHGTKIGFCHWITNVGEEWASVSDENIPGNVPKPIRTHRLRVEGSAIVPELKNRIRFEGSLKVDTRRVWQELDARLSIRPSTWQIHSLAEEQTVKLALESGGTRVEHSFKFSELRDPTLFLTQVFGPVVGEWFDQSGMFPFLDNAVSAGSGPKWEAFEDTLWMGHHQARVYRLQTRLLDHYQVSILISRVGEILRVELPDELILVNDQLVTL
jgi:hypothetical protein